MTTAFYAPPSCFRAEDYVALPEDEAGHAVRVLRRRAGDEIVVVDGAGGWHRVRLDVAERREAAGVVLETRRDVGEPPYALRLGLALLKNRNRFELFLEKAVELGVREVVPLLTQRTEKARLNAARANNILVAAMKQSGRSRLLHLAAPRPLADVLQDPADACFLAHEQLGAEAGLARALARHPAASTFAILVGPEGGFTDEEVAAATQAGYAPVSLGPRRLRAETAALVAATAVLLHHA